MAPAGLDGQPVTKSTKDGRYVLLMDARDGRFLASTSDGLCTVSKASDAACWGVSWGGSDGFIGPFIFFNAETRVNIQGLAAELPPDTPMSEGVVDSTKLPAAVTLRCPRPIPPAKTKQQQQQHKDSVGLHTHIGTGGSLHADGPGSTYLVMHGPDRLPSAALSELQQTGYTVLPSLIAPSTIAALRHTCALDAGTNSGPIDASPPGGPNASPAVLKCQVNPVVVYLLHGGSPPSSSLVRLHSLAPSPLCC
jgi:hypothetical protein